MAPSTPRQNSRYSLRPLTGQQTHTDSSSDHNRAEAHPQTGVSVDHDDPQHEDERYEEADDGPIPVAPPATPRLTPVARPSRALARSMTQNLHTIQQIRSNLGFANPGHDSILAVPSTSQSPPPPSESSQSPSPRTRQTSVFSRNPDASSQVEGSVTTPTQRSESSLTELGTTPSPPSDFRLERSSVGQGSDGGGEREDGSREEDGDAGDAGDYGDAGELADAGDDANGAEEKQEQEKDKDGEDVMVPMTPVARRDIIEQEPEDDDVESPFERFMREQVSPSSRDLVEKWREEQTPRGKRRRLDESSDNEG